MFPQKYKQLIGRCALLFLAGTALQLCIGRVDASFLSYPWNWVAVVNYLYILILLYVKQDEIKCIKRIYDRPAFLISLVSMLVLTLLFGLIPQDASMGGLLGLFGFNQMSSSWIFVLFLLHFMTVLGLKAIEDVHHWKKRSLPAVLMHVSFFVILSASVFGSGEKVRLRVTAVEGHPVGVGVTDTGKQIELPFTIRLKDFSLEEYPPKVYLFSENQLSKDFIVLEDEKSCGLLGAWEIECLEFLDRAGRASEDSAYIDMHHVGATTAAYLKVHSTLTGESVEGWVSCGSHIFLGSTLILPDGQELVMPRREVKKYLSELEVWEGEEKHSFELSVNRPATIGSWKIYQSGYDTTRGRWSTMSLLECVKDGGYVAVHIAMWTILLSGVLMFKRKKEGKK